ncbi:glycosyltransferase [bacterium]|nr:glycosyltransferase [bacterium]
MKPRVLVLYEYSIAGLAHGSAHVRLLRPLRYPAVAERFEIVSAPIYSGQPAEIVIVDRSWRPDINPDMADALIEQVRAAGAKLLHHLDDDLVSLPLSFPLSRLFTAMQRESVERFVRGADALLVSTPVLAERMERFNRRLYTVPNALDERLFVPGTANTQSIFADKPVVIGYMGTLTHDADLLMVLDALTAAHERTEITFELELIGVVNEAETWRLLRSLPFPVRQREAPTAEYPHFMAWFTRDVHWDIGLAPLQETPFNRCKSDLKFLDYSAAGVPGIFSAGPVYSPGVEHGVTGWLADSSVESWRDALLTLLAAPDLRRQIAANAQRHLLQQRTLAQHGHEWAAVLEAVLYG